MENGKIVITNDKNEKLECDVLFTLDSDETNKSYIVYTDNSKDKEGKIQTYASVYDPNKENPELEEIKTQKEWDLIQNVLKSLQEKEEE